MLTNLLIDLAAGKLPTDNALARALYETCDDVHSSCDDACPVFNLNRSRIPWTATASGGRNCSCFKDGAAMLAFIREKLAKR